MAFGFTLGSNSNPIHKIGSRNIPNVWLSFPVIWYLLCLFSVALTLLHNMIAPLHPSNISFVSAYFGPQKAHRGSRSLSSFVFPPALHYPRPYPVFVLLCTFTHLILWTRWMRLNKLHFDGIVLRFAVLALSPQRVRWCTDGSDSLLCPRVTFLAWSDK